MLNPNQHIIPKDGNTLVNLSNSILKYMDVKTENETLKILDSEFEKRKYKNVILQVFDGLGMNILNHNISSDSILVKNLKTVFTSVFPSTTVAATKSILSAKYPSEHGWLGWDMYFKEYGETISVFRNIIKDTNNISKNDISKNKDLEFEDIFQKIKKNELNDIHIFWKYDKNNPVNTLKEMKESIQKTLTDKDLKKNNNRKNFIYSYYEEPDSSIHRFGVSGNEVKEEIRKIEKIIEEIYEIIDDETIYIITADHGLIDVEYIILEDYPEIFNMLERTTGIEERAFSIKLKSNVKKEIFEKEFKKRWAEYFVLYTKDQVLEKNIFGGEINKELVLDNIGDYIGISIADKCLRYKRGEEEFKAYHSGITKEEMEIPLIIIKK